MKTKIINGQVIRGGQIRRESVCFADGVIVPEFGEADRVIDAKGNFVSAGFIDIHVHGGGGHDFNDATEEAIRDGVAFHTKHGTTAITPTCTSGDPNEMVKVFAAYRKVKADPDRVGADLLGIHMEGPYFALSQAGAQDPKYVHSPVKEEYEYLLSQTDDIVRWSAAPEMDIGYKFAEDLTRRGIMVSAGHTDADCRQMLDAVEHGYTHMTHFYSCMRSVVRVNAVRVAGAIEAAYLDDRITVEMIADGMHLPLELLKLIYKLKGPDKIALVTDAIRAAGMPDGAETVIGSLSNGMKVIVDQGVAWLENRQAFAGSVATTDRLVRTVLKAGIPLTDAVKMASEVPAKLLNCHAKGTLDLGKDADILIFDSDIQMKKVFVRGKEIPLS